DPGRGRPGLGSPRRSTGGPTAGQRDESRRHRGAHTPHDAEISYTSVAVPKGALENFSADFLTERLRASGVLPRARVTSSTRTGRRLSSGRVRPWRRSSRSALGLLARPLLGHGFRPREADLGYPLVTDFPQR